MNDVKENLKIGEYCVTLDFSENYSFVIQDEAQGYHWASDHATVHPFVIYFKGEEKTEHISYVIISDCLEHNTTAVYCFQKKLLDFLKSKFETVQKIYYFSDGSAAQYKNFQTSAFTRKILKLMLSGTFLPQPMAKGLVMVSEGQ